MSLKIQLTITQNEENDRKEDVIEDTVVLSESVKPAKTGVRKVEKSIPEDEKNTKTETAGKDIKPVSDTTTARKSIMDKVLIVKPKF